jgi:hypothetical protein
MNARVESLVEDYNQVRETLARTRVEQARTRQQVLVTTRYREQVVAADRAALDRVDRLRRQVEALAARLADQAEPQERLQARLAASAARSRPVSPPSAATTSS